MVCLCFQSVRFNRPAIDQAASIRGQRWRDKQGYKKMSAFCVEVVIFKHRKIKQLIKSQRHHLGPNLNWWVHTAHVQCALYIIQRERETIAFESNTLNFSLKRPITIDPHTKHAARDSETPDRIENFFWTFYFAVWNESNWAFNDECSAGIILFDLFHWIRLWDCVNGIGQRRQKTTNTEKSIRLTCAAFFIVAVSWKLNNIIHWIKITTAHWSFIHSTCLFKVCVIVCTARH